MQLKLIKICGWLITTEGSTIRGGGDLVEQWSFALEKVFGFFFKH